jgi:queuine tRNA-ribosyltransferase
MPKVCFEVVAADATSHARAGILRTTHGAIATPAFAPVGTQGTVKSVAPDRLSQIGVGLIMSNLYHLAMRPGIDVVTELGGLHRLAGWDRPMMTDSGGYQVFSLEGLRSVDDDGVTFRSHVDGSTHRFTPESVMQAQQALGADLVMPLDVCSPYPVGRDAASRDALVTRSWAARAMASHHRNDQLLYGIVQGSVFKDLREESARATSEMGFRAFAIGGVSVGESKEQMHEALDACLPHLPPDAPRHLLGVGHPDDVVAAIAKGIDTFDCVAPTRWARNGGAMTMSGRMNLRNAVYARDERPLEETCGCYACAHFSRGAIRHFVKSGEILGLYLLTVHNLHFLVDLTERARSAILDGTFSAWRRAFASEYRVGPGTEGDAAAPASH